MKLKRDWNEKIKEYKSSGLGVTAWCKTQNIPDSTFSYHLHKHSRAKSPSFIELKEKPSNIKIHYKNIAIELDLSSDMKPVERILKMLVSLC
jgi:hypothetical protein